jgi:hypothetical protein
VGFLGNCVDVGVVRQFYAPSIGLVSSEETTFGGPRLYELLYYRVATGAGAGPEVSFTVALDSSRYKEGDTLQARLTLRNSSLQPIHLLFPSSQSFDLKITDEKGQLGTTWSLGREFLMRIREETVTQGEKTYGLSLPLIGLPPGRYTGGGLSDD